MGRTAYIVWNQERSEGVIFAGDEESHTDAVQCQLGTFSDPASTLGETFAELYEDDDRTLETVELP